MEAEKAQAANRNHYFLKFDTEGKDRLMTVEGESFLRMGETKYVDWQDGEMRV